MKGCWEQGYGGGVRVQGGIMRGDEDNDGGKDGGKRVRKCVDLFWVQDDANI